MQRRRSRRVRIWQQVSVIKQREGKWGNDREEEEEEEEEDEYYSSNKGEEEEYRWGHIKVVEHHDCFTMNKFIITLNISSIPHRILHQIHYQIKQSNWLTKTNQSKGPIESFEARIRINEVQSKEWSIT